LSVICLAPASGLMLVFPPEFRRSNSFRLCAIPLLLTNRPHPPYVTVYCLSSLSCCCFFGSKCAENQSSGQQKSPCGDRAFLLIVSEKSFNSPPLSHLSTMSKCSIVCLKHIPLNDRDKYKSQFLFKANLFSKTSVILGSKMPKAAFFAQIRADRYFILPEPLASVFGVLLVLIQHCAGLFFRNKSFFRASHRRKGKSLPVLLVFCR